MKPAVASRPRSFSLAERRARWASLIERARTHGDWAARQIAVDKATNTNFARAVIDCGGVAFPLEHVSAASASAAFLAIARGFVTAARDEDRQALGAFLREGAICLDTLLTAESHRAANVWKLQMPKDFD